MPEVERHPHQSIGGLWGVALFLSLPPSLSAPAPPGGEFAREPPAEARMRSRFPKVGNCFLA
jgi:hypothetical protein